jgi:hypothetical protein
VDARAAGDHRGPATRLAALALLLLAGGAGAQPLLLMGEQTAADRRWEGGLLLPDGRTLDGAALAAGLDGTIMQSGDVVVFDLRNRQVVRLASLPPTQRSDLLCRDRASRRYDRALGNGFIPVPSVFDPVAWLAGPGRLLWLPDLPRPGACALRPAALTLTPAGIEFNPPQVGQAQQRNVTVRNTSASAVTVFDVAPLAAPFALAVDGCSGVTLAANATCAVQVGFQPVGPAQATGLLAVESDDRSLPSQRAVVAGGVFDLLFANGFQ